MKKFAIITVCLNVENTIEDTITSILEQTCIDFEFIIKDGGSTDNTISIAEAFAPAFAQKGIPYRIISQPDQGIYDAMNQAASEVQGEWVLYMNAGDGDRVECSDAGYLYRKAYPLDRMRDRLPFCHQSVFVRKRLYDEEAYSLRYRLCSDYVFFFHKYHEEKKFAYLPIAVCIFDRHGVSSDGKSVAQELLKIHEEMPIRDEEIIQMMKKEIENYDRKISGVKRTLSNLIPKRVRTKRWELQRKAEGWKTKEEFFKEKEENGGRINKDI